MTGIVGRERELDRLDAFVRGEGRGLVLTGGAGIGKTTLWHAAVEAARERGLRVLTARGEAEFALAGVGDLLERVPLDEGDHAARTDEPPRAASPFDRACNLLVEARAKRAANDHRGERTALDEATRLFEAIGAHGWGRAHASTDQTPLTPAEQRVAELAAAGRRNKEIARALEVAVHTVEVHLSNAYAKLGIRSRTQLATKLSPAGTSPR